MTGKKLIRIISFMVAFIFVASLLPGCTSSGNKGGSTGQAASSAGTSGEGFKESEPGVYPIVTKEPVTLTYWKRLDPTMAKYFQNFAETKLAKELEKRTGIKVEYIHPAIGTDNEDQAFQLMIASGDLPDIIEYNFHNKYPGGPAVAIKDKKIIRLNEVIEKNAPDLKKILDNNPAELRVVKTDQGDIFVFPMLREREDVKITNGPQIREDWLKQLNLERPETITEWYTTLKAFKEAGLCEYPFTWSKGMKLHWSGEFTGAYGIVLGFFQLHPREPGKVTLGAMLPEYKQFLAEMKKWYDEGLLDPEFAVQDRETLRAKVREGKVGAIANETGGSTMWQINKAWKDENPNTTKSLVATKHVALNKGEIPKFGPGVLDMVDRISGAAITTDCKYPDVAAKWLNYGFCKEGAILYNCGIENESFTFVEGTNYNSYFGPMQEFRFADFILKQSDTSPADKVRQNYCLRGIGGPYASLKEVVEPDPSGVWQEKEAHQIWKISDQSLRLPELTVGEDVAEEYGKYWTDIQTYVDEKMTQFIIGDEPLENFDTVYQAELKKLGVDFCIDVWQKLYDDFMSR